LPCNIGGKLPKSILERARRPKNLNVFAQVTAELVIFRSCRQNPAREVRVAEAASNPATGEGLVNADLGILGGYVRPAAGTWLCRAFLGMYSV